MTRAMTQLPHSPHFTNEQFSLAPFPTRTSNVPNSQMKTPIWISFTCVTSARFKIRLSAFIFGRFESLFQKKIWMNNEEKFYFDFDEKLRRHEKMKNQYYSLAWKDARDRETWKQMYTKCELRMPLERNYKHLDLILFPLLLSLPRNKRKCHERRRNKNQNLSRIPLNIWWIRIEMNVSRTFFLFFRFHMAQIIKASRDAARAGFIRDEIFHI